MNLDFRLGLGDILCIGFFTSERKREASSFEAMVNSKKTASPGEKSLTLAVSFIVATSAILN
ncbi:hypothetical protein PbDSM24746_57130 [Paenibacillus macerans]|nr:hypothetical protein PbDSM24746_57130 [Paenibacillus macerans]GBK71936.1 hypothetical protein PbJCM17693_56440 [Paenibacillus macerans]GIP12859.1 hypothetical protein J1TS5_50290 [Paenibacillus macerans]